jgi:hypothetical protein
MQNQAFSHLLDPSSISESMRFKLSSSMPLAERVQSMVAAESIDFTGEDFLVMKSLS